MSVFEVAKDPSEEPELAACPSCGEISAALVGGRLQCSECGWIEAQSPSPQQVGARDDNLKKDWKVARDGIEASAGKTVETGHAPSLRGIAVEHSRRLTWTPAETWRAMKARDPEAILYLSVCCGREQTHSGPTRYCAFCGRECAGDVYEPSGDGVASRAGGQPAGASSTLDSMLQDSEGV